MFAVHRMSWITEEVVYEAQANPTPSGIGHIYLQRTSNCFQKPYSVWYDHSDGHGNLITRGRVSVCDYRLFNNSSSHGSVSNTEALKHIKTAFI